MERVHAPDWSWEEACEMGIMARNLRDLSNWVLGLLTWRIEIKWGEDSVGELAKLLGFQPTTLRQYRWVVKTFGKDYEPNKGLPWSYYRLAAATENPKKTINNIIDQSFNYKQAERYIKGVPQPQECQHEFKTIIIEKCTICGFVKQKEVQEKEL